MSNPFVFSAPVFASTPAAEPKHEKKEDEEDDGKGGDEHLEEESKAEVPLILNLLTFVC